MGDRHLKLKLKEAKDALHSGDMKEAITACKHVLEVDKDHYMAHLLIAKAYQELGDQKTATTFLRRAVTLTTDPVIPYQGLVKCCPPSELPDILVQLIKIQPDKYEEHFGKLVECSKKTTDPDACIIALDTLLQGLGDSEEDEKKRNSIYATLSDLFMKSGVPDKWKLLYARSLQQTIKRSHVDQHENYRKCIRLFSELKCTAELLTTCCDMFEAFKNDSYPLEWICKVFTENMRTKEIPDMKKLLRKDIKDYVDALYKMNPKSILGLITKGMHHVDAGEFFEALDIFNIVNEMKPNLATCLRALVQVHRKFRCFQLAEKCYKEMNPPVKDLFYVECLLHNGKAEEAKTVIQEIGDSSSVEDRALLGYLTVWNKMLLSDDGYRECLIKLENLDQVWYLRAKILVLSITGKRQEALEAFPELAAHMTSEDFVRRGELEYHLQRPGYIMTFTNALKSDLYNSDAFYWLGRVYQEDHDHLRSLKCLDKCLRMNPLNEEALKGLKTLSVLSEDNDKLYKEILEVATRHALELGLYGPIKLMADFYKDHEDINEAAIYYRKALRFSTSDCDCWMQLGQIMFTNGSYAVAEKIFGKISQMFPSQSTLAQLKTAVIKTKMNLFSDAEVQFEELLVREPCSIQVLQEYAGAHLVQAEEKRAQRLFGRAREHIQKAVELLARAYVMNANSVDIATMLAKSINFAANLPVQLRFLALPCSLALNDHSSDSKTTVSNQNLFLLANKFFENASNSSTSGSNDQVYFLMAENHFQRYTHNENEPHEAVEALKSAVSCIKRAIALNADRWEYWNLYGLLLSTDEIGEPSLAEEVFAVALETNKTSFTIWANLGTLYLKCNEISAANRAFGKAQENEIGYENGWLGQAMIADRLGAEDEAMGLYRHCLELDYHRLAALGYAKWVVHRMDQLHVKKFQFAIENMYAVPLCIDALGWYLKEVDHKASVKSLCYLGYLAFHKGNFTLAVESYLKATEKAEGEELDDICFNLGYLYLLLERPEQAVKSLKHIQKISLQAQIALAVAHFYAKDYKVTYSIYESALESLAQTDEERVQILTAMAALVYEFQGEEDAKMILMQCVTLNNPIKGLLNICALYLLHDDLQTAELVVKELRAYENDPEYCVDISFLIAVFYTKKTEYQQARNYVLSMIHKFPTHSKLRTLFVNLVVAGPKQGQPSLLHQASVRMAESVLALTHGELLKSDSRELSRALALISLTNEGVNERKQRIFAQKAMFVNPDSNAARRAMERCR